jgi:nucleotide-binding universal stress UspA family protein
MRGNIQLAAFASAFWRMQLQTATNLQLWTNSEVPAMLAIHKILHPTDFSRNSDYAFHMACALARDYGARLLVLHVRPLPTAAYGEFGALPPDPAEQREELQMRLEKITPTDQSIAIEHRLAEGEIAWEIIHLADEEKCDLIVMGTHGRTGLSRLLMGSVAEMVVRKATCPVLTVKNPVPEEVSEMAAVHEPAAV